MKTREDLMRSGSAYWSSRALLSAVELGVFEALGRRRRSAKALAKAMGADAAALGLLLDALCGLGILAKAKTAYALKRDMLPLLTEGEASALPALRHHVRLWRRWDALTDVVRTGVDERPEGGFRGDADDAKAFTLAMQSGARRQAEPVADEVSLAGRRHLLDLGGGPATYGVAFLRRVPGMRLTVVDLPHVCTAGAQIVAKAAADVADRVTWHAADLEQGPLPEDADAAFLSHVIHSAPEAGVKAIFGHVRRALRPGGVLVVRDFFTSADHTQPPSASMFALNMLVNATGGRSWSAAEIQAWLRALGFERVGYRRSKAMPNTGYVRASVPLG